MLSGSQGEPRILSLDDWALGQQWPCLSLQVAPVPSPFLLPPRLHGLYPNFLPCHYDCLPYDLQLLVAELLAAARLRGKCLDLVGNMSVTLHEVG